MAHTLESLVDRLQADGVEAGREAAERIRNEAQEKADQLVRDAEAEAKRIVTTAEAESEQILIRTRSDLKLAARDTVARLGEALERAMTAVLFQAVSQKLENTDFLAELIKDVVGRYAQADADGETSVAINVSEPMRERLTHWVIETFHEGSKKNGISLDLHGSLSDAGFEYQVTDGTVEITTESVVQLLSEIVTAELRKLLASAFQD